VSNTNDNQTLTALRDALLPRLMSGRLRVKPQEGTKQFPEMTT